MTREQFKKNADDQPPIPFVVPTDIPETELGTMKINGDSLERFGIRDGDYVVVRQTERCQISPNSLCIVASTER